MDSNGNRVNVGNFDSEGLNVDNNWDDNRNGNLGVSSARHFNLSIRNVPLSGAFLCKWSVDMWFGTGAR